MLRRRTIHESHIWETIRGSSLDPAYGAQSARTAGQERVGTALCALLETRPTMKTLDALDELLEAIKARVRELR